MFRSKKKFFKGDFDMSNEDNYIGNISTVVKYISMLFAGWFIGLLVSHGFNLPISETELTQLISSAIFLALAHIDATNPNTIFNKKTTSDEITGDENEGC